MSIMHAYWNFINTISENVDVRGYWVEIDLTITIYHKQQLVNFVRNRTNFNCHSNVKQKITLLNASQNLFISSAYSISIYNYGTAVSSIPLHRWGRCVSKRLAVSICRWVTLKSSFQAMEIKRAPFINRPDPANPLLTLQAKRKVLFPGGIAMDE